MQKQRLWWFSILVLFIIFQTTDGIFTYVGIFNTVIGQYYEINPILVYYFQKIGIIPTLILGKAFSVFLGMIIYRHAEKKAFGLRAGIYLSTITLIMAVVNIRHLLALSIIN